MDWIVGGKVKDAEKWRLDKGLIFGRTGCNSRTAWWGTGQPFSATSPPLAVAGDFRLDCRVVFGRSDHLVKLTLRGASRRT